MPLGLVRARVVVPLGLVRARVVVPLGLVRARVVRREDTEIIVLVFRSFAVANKKQLDTYVYGEEHGMAWTCLAHPRSALCKMYKQALTNAGRYQGSRN